ncbi:MAG: hypothetical protein HZB46_10710, partial [Solirubrobacterales bacterium]|nr:hypothetical protein [Solirubrobacterales bacterium]
EPRADGTSVSAFQHCQGFLDDGSYDCVGAVKSTDGATYPSCDDLPDDPSPNPANPSQVAYVGCHSSGQDALVVTGPDRAGERVVACDDSEQDDPSWSPSGDRLVTAEAGAERGLWVYGAGNAGCGAGSLRHAVVAPDDVAFDSPRFAGPDRIVFEAKGELWSVAASCDRCAFPAQATQLTTGGDNHEPAWTADPLAVPVAPSGGGGGGDGGTTPGGTTPGGGAPSDTTRPVLTVTAAGAQRILRQSRSIVLRVRSGEAATLTAKGTIAVPGKDPSIKATTMRLAAGRTATLKLKLSATALAAVRRAWARHRKATAVLKLSARDAAGNAATATRRIALRR